MALEKFVAYFWSDCKDRTRRDVSRCLFMPKRKHQVGDLVLFKNKIYGLVVDSNPTTFTVWWFDNFLKGQFLQEHDYVSLELVTYGT